MTWLAPRLKERIRIREAVQTPNDAGGYDQTYRDLLACWAEVKPFGRGRYFRRVQTEIIPTYIATLRLGALRDERAGGFARAFNLGHAIVTGLLGRMFGNGFDAGFISRGAINPASGEYYILWERGAEAEDYGNLFRVVAAASYYDEFIELELRELHEVGTGMQQ